MRVFTAAQMKRAEQEAVQRGSSYEQLMQNAAEGAAHKILQLAQRQNLEREILVLCGRGNNAGDGFVLAAYLAAAGWRVQVCELADGPYSPLAELNYGRLPATVQRVSAEEACFEMAVLCDAVYGTGFHGVLPQPIQQVLMRANAAEGLRVALDIPSGVNCDTGEASPGSFCADETLTFGAYKPALMRPACRAQYGEVSVIDIGL